MIHGWRVVFAEYAEAAFTGQGARLFGGRWNHEGTTVIYISGSQAGALLEKLVHLLPRDRNRRLLSFRVEIEEGVTIRDVGIPPAGWRIEPPPAATQDIGTEWVRVGTSAVLKVPSVLLPDEVNYLLNPTHRDYGRISAEGPVDVTLDPRLWK